MKLERDAQGLERPHDNHRHVRSLAQAAPDDDDEIGDARQFVAVLLERLAHLLQDFGVVGVVGGERLGDFAVGATVAPDALLVSAAPQEAKAVPAKAGFHGVLRLGHTFLPLNWSRDGISHYNIKIHIRQ